MTSLQPVVRGDATSRVLQINDPQLFHLCIALCLNAQTNLNSMAVCASTNTNRLGWKKFIGKFCEGSKSKCTSELDHLGYDLL